MTLSPESDDRWRLMTTALVDDDADWQRLAKAFRRLSWTWSWLQVEQEALKPALRTWKSLTKAAAKREGLTATGFVLIGDQIPIGIVVVLGGDASSAAAGSIDAKPGRCARRTAVLASEPCGQTR
jgi:hypothetical protein